MIRAAALSLWWTSRDAPAGLQGGQDSNLQPAVLETAALPIEPPPFGVDTKLDPVREERDTTP